MATNKEVISTSQGASKAAIARTIFDSMRESPRKEVLQQFMTQAGLTEKGAQTYYQNFRRDAGMVSPRVEHVQVVPGSSQNTGRRTNTPHS